MSIRKVVDARRPLATKVAAALEIIIDSWTGQYVVNTGFRVRVRRIDESKTSTRFVLDTDSRTPASPEQRQKAWLYAPTWKTKAGNLRPEECAIICESTTKGIRIAIRKRDEDTNVWAPDSPA